MKRMTTALLAFSVSAVAHAFTATDVVQMCKSDDPTDRAFCKGLIHGATLAMQAYFSRMPPFEDYSVERFNGHRSHCSPGAFQKSAEPPALDIDHRLAYMVGRLARDKPSDIMAMPFGQVIWAFTFGACHQ